MVDYGGRNFNTDFSGLVTTVIIMGVVGGICLGGFETLRQMKRLPNRHFRRWWRSDPQARHAKTGVGTNRTGIGDPPPIQTTQEDWEMGHLYHARTFHATTPSPFLSRWPLGWAWQSLRLKDWFYATHCGMDNVVYVRFLRACNWWLLLQVLTTAPILLAIHFTFSQGVPLEDMSRASLAYLVTVPDESCPDPHSSDCPRHPNIQGRKLLWIHLCLLWWISVTWCYGLWWIGKGSINIRRRLLDKIQTDRAAALEELAAKKAKEQQDADIDDKRIGQPMRAAQGFPQPAVAGDADSSEGWRQRTILVTNLPATMRDEASLRRYFEEFLRPDDASVTDIDVQSEIDGVADAQSPSDDSRIVGSEDNKKPLSRRGALHALSNSHQGHPSASSDTEDPVSNDHDAHAALELERRLATPPQLTFNLPHGPEPDLMPRRNQRSPIQTVIVVRKMGELSSMLTRRQEILTQLEEAHIKLAQSVLAKVGRKHEKNQKTFLAQLKRDRKAGHKRHENGNTVESSQSSNDDVENGASPLPGSPLDILTQHLARFVDGSPRSSPTATKLAQPPRGYNKAAESATEDTSDLETVWEVLAALPRQLLDPYQPVTSLSALFRGQKVPSIDYLLTKLNLLTALIAEMKARPPTEYEATSSAFVTFRDPRQARMVWRELKSQIVMRVRMAPEVKDLDWDRIMRTSFTGDLVRGFGVNAFFWAFTVFWVIPVQIITTALFSVEHLKEVIPGLARFFNAHQRLEGFVSVTLPTVLVSLITMSVPELVFQISKRAQGFVTWSSLYDQCLCRYWKFIVCNIVIFFCIGTTTLEAILQQIGNPGQSKILDNIAFAFPTAAPFFVSYLILGLALHTGFELLGFMIPILQHFFSANKATTPRARALRTLPRNFNRYYWLPFHILIMTIVFIFAILNPLIIPFALIYMFFAMVVFKKNFAFTYYRRFNEKDGVIYFVRLFRFTLDGLVTGQVVILIFFSVTNQQKAYIGLTAVLIPLTLGFKWLGTRLWKSQCRAIEDDEANAICGIATAHETMLPHGNKDYGNEMGRDETERAPLDARASGRFPTVLATPTNRSRLIRVWQHLHDSFNANGADRPSYLARKSAQGKPVDHAVRTGAKLALRAPKVVAKKAKQDGRNIKEVAKISLGVDKVMKMEAEQEALKVIHDKNVDQETVVRRASKGAKFQHTEHDRVHRQPTTRSPSRRIPSTNRAPSARRKVSQRSHLQADGEGMTRGNSMRSIATAEKPFLSGFEAVANHAPVASEDGLAGEYADGEELTTSYTYTLPRSRSQRTVSGGRKERQYPSLAESAAATISPEDFAPWSSAPPPAPYGREPLQDPSSLTHDAKSDEGQKAWSGDDTHLSGDKAGGFHSDDDDEEEEEESLTSDDGPLVRPHAKIRWDDTPNNQARYNNPFYSCELDPFLWFPRDPLGPLNLCDTIEWHGAALVSSDGGHGRVGEWEEDDDDEDDDDDEADYDEFGNYIRDDTTSRRSRLSRIEGHEEIMMNSELARRLEEEEDVHQVIDPAASLPKNVMDEYREAINLGEDEGSRYGDEEDDPGRTGSRPPERRHSNASGRSLGSPAPSVRQELDREFGRQNAMLPASASNEADMTVQSAASAAPPLPPGILQQQTPALGAAETLKRDPSTSSVFGGGGGTAKARTHFAPDPPERGHQHHATDGGGQSPTTPVTPRQQRHGTLGSRSGTRRRVQDASAVSSGGASIRSTSTYGRTITMRQALQAEVLEEERRRTIRDKLATRHRKHSMKRGKSSKSGRGSEAGDEESRPAGRAASSAGGMGHANDDDVEEAVDDEIHHESEILARHQRALSRRRRVEERERGQTQAQVNVSGSHLLRTPTSATSPRSPSHSRFASMGATFRRSSMMRNPSATRDQGAPAESTGATPQSRPQSSFLLQTPQRPQARRESSAASTIIYHGPPLPAAAATPMAASGSFPVLQVSRQGNGDEEAEHSGPTESLEMREISRRPENPNPGTNDDDDARDPQK